MICRPYGRCSTQRLTFTVAAGDDVNTESVGMNVVVRQVLGVHRLEVTGDVDQPAPCRRDLRHATVTTSSRRRCPTGRLAGCSGRRAAFRLLPGSGTAVPGARKRNKYADTSVMHRVGASGAAQLAGGAGGSSEGGALEAGARAGGEDCDSDEQDRVEHEAGEDVRVDGVADDVAGDVRVAAVWAAMS
jgi:hypothetical protein